MKINHLLKSLAYKIKEAARSAARTCKHWKNALITRAKMPHPAIRNAFGRGFRWIGQHREAVAYYSVLALVLAALGTAAYGYRNGSLRRSTANVALQSPEPAAIAQAIPNPTATPEPVSALLAPVDGEVLQAFAADELVWSDALGMWQTHPGVDFAADAGEAVVAAADATVLDAYVDSLYGNTIILDLGDGRTMRYASLNTLQLVEVGQTVARGDIISSAGTCDAEDDLSAHVHLEYYENGAPVDPITLMREN